MLRCAIAIAIGSSMLLVSAGCGGGPAAGPATPPTKTAELPPKQAPEGKGKNPAGLPAKAID